MSTNCAPLLADLFLHPYEADFRQRLLKNEDRKEAQTFNSIFCYIDGILSLTSSRFGYCLHRIYPKPQKVNNTTDTQRSASYLDIYLENDKRKIKNKTTNVMT
jgi:hypothetical protein